MHNARQLASAMAQEPTSKVSDPDPGGPNDPPGTYDEFLDCQAATEPRLLLGLLLLGLALLIVVVKAAANGSARSVAR